jgi:hypothetical protein
MGCYPIKNPKDILQLSLESCITPKNFIFSILIRLNKVSQKLLAYKPSPTLLFFNDGISETI